MSASEPIRRLPSRPSPPKRTSILPSPPTGAFSAKALEAAMKQIIREFCVELQCVARRSQGHSTARTCPHSEIAFRYGSCTKTYDHTDAFTI